MILWYKKNRGLFWSVLVWLVVMIYVIVKFVVLRVIR